MQTGMLWFDGSGRALEEKVRAAAAYYERKYGVKPNRAFAPAGTENMTVDGIQVKADRSVLPSHLWIGAEEK